MHLGIEENVALEVEGCQHAAIGSIR
jgi:hypothetical protein